MQRDDVKFISYGEYQNCVPSSGRHFVGVGDTKSVIVYQSLPREIARPAVRNRSFSTPFNFDRMSWIKPGFLWTMHRSNWGQLDDCVLAIRIDKRGLFELLGQSVSSKYDRANYGEKRAWDKAIKNTNVVTQWDPDYDIHDRRLQRKALQIGLRGKALKRYATKLVIEIKDLSDFVRQQRDCLRRQCYDQVLVPNEQLIELPEDLFQRLGAEAAR